MVAEQTDWNNLTPGPGELRMGDLVLDAFRSPWNGPQSLATTSSTELADGAQVDSRITHLEPMGNPRSHATSACMANSPQSASDRGRSQGLAKIETARSISRSPYRLPLPDENLPQTTSVTPIKEIWEELCLLLPNDAMSSVPSCSRTVHTPAQSTHIKDTSGPEEVDGRNSLPPLKPVLDARRDTRVESTLTGSVRPPRGTATKFHRRHSSAGNPGCDAVPLISCLPLHLQSIRSNGESSSICPSIQAHSAQSSTARTPLRQTHPVHYPYTSPMNVRSRAGFMRRDGNDFPTNLDGCSSLDSEAKHVPSQDGPTSPAASKAHTLNPTSFKTITSAALPILLRVAESEGIVTSFQLTPRAASHHTSPSCINGLSYCFIRY